MTVSPQPYLPQIVRDWDEDAPGKLHQCLEGSMVFVDISGFTAMSERLARHGKLGAEELTAVISATFGELLGAAYSYGANLLKFGGDALLLFFSGEGHERRACAAAQAMQPNTYPLPAHCMQMTLHEGGAWLRRRPGTRVIDL